MKYLKRYNLFESLENMSKEQFYNILNGIIGFKKENAIFFRGEKDANDYSYIKADYRKSQTSSNLQNLILSQFDYLPDRTHSIVFGDINVVDKYIKDVIGSFDIDRLYVIPCNYIKIAIAPTSDINMKSTFNVINKFLEELPYDYPYEYFLILNRIFRISGVYESDITKENFEEMCNKVDQNIEKIKQRSLKSVVLPYLNSGKLFYQYIMDEFDPIKNGYKVVDFHWDKMNDKNYRKQFKGKECWIDSECLMVKKDKM